MATLKFVTLLTQNACKFALLSFLPFVAAKADYPYHSHIPAGVPTYEGVYGNPYAPPPMREVDVPHEQKPNRIRPRHKVISSKGKTRTVSKAHRNAPRNVNEVDLFVDLSSQKMQVYLNGKHTHTWSISSGRKGYRTPTGYYQPTIMKKMHRSRKYNNAPMPYSIFFKGGYAIHGGSGLGRPRSHGCVRISRSNARKLYNWVKKAGRHNTDITIRQ